MVRVESVLALFALVVAMGVFNMFMYDAGAWGWIIPMLIIGGVVVVRQGFQK